MSRLGIVLMVALVLRAAALLATRDVAPIRDESLYLIRAEAMLDGHGHTGSFQALIQHPKPLAPGERMRPTAGAFQPPLYPAFVAAVFRITGRSVTAMKWVQVLLGTLVVWLVYRLGARWFDEVVGLVAAALSAGYPTLIFFSHTLWSETVFLVLFLTALTLLTTREFTPWSAATSGAVLALAALTRSIVVYLLPLLIIWLIITRPRNRRLTRSLAMLVVAFGLVIAPWTVRNHRVLHGFVLIDTNGPVNVWRGNNPATFANRPASRGASYRPPFSRLPLAPVSNATWRDLVWQMLQESPQVRPTDPEVMRYAAVRSWEFIRQDPAGFVRRAWIKMVDTWNPTSFWMRHFRLGAYESAPRWVESLVGWASVMSYLAWMGLGLWGLVRSRRAPAAVLTWMVLAFTAALPAVAFGLTRFRLPVMPLLAVFAASMLVTLSRSAPIGPARRFSRVGGLLQRVQGRRHQGRRGNVDHEEAVNDVDRSQ